MRAFAILFGLLFMAVGAAGFLPQFSPGDQILERFPVNFELNCLHLGTGIIAFIAGLTTRGIARLFFQIFGVIYAIVAVAGFYYGDTQIFDLLANNRANTWFHTAAAIVFLIIGYGSRD